MGNSLSDYINRRDSLQERIAKLNQNNAQLQREIEILEKAERKLKPLVDKANNIKERVKKDNCTKGYAWRGQYKKKYDELFEKEIKKDAKSFADSIKNMYNKVSATLRSRKTQLKTGRSDLSTYINQRTVLQGKINDMAGGGFR